jgi:uncharacterized protein YcsI (UPF0317 family)
MRNKTRSGFKSCLCFSLCLFLLGIVGCSEESEQLFEIAEIEERHNNDSDARKLYERIIEIDPKGYFATKAKERLAELDKKTAKSKQKQN